MSTVTVSDKGQVVIPATIRRRLGISPGSKLDFELEGDTIRVRLCRSIPPSRAEDGYGLLRCDRPGERRLADFDVADALHLAGSAHCTALCTFDDRRFAPRANRLAGIPPVMVPVGESLPEGNAE